MSQTQEIWQCPGCGTRVDISSLGFYAEVSCPQCGHTDHVHTVLANFEIEGLLGIGGMSVVLRGRDMLLNRPVAIKLLNETYRNQPERIARFEKECAMMAKVHHENVVSVYSAGWANSEFYIAMELLDGRNLESVVTKERPLRPATAIDVATRIARGLEAAHKAGLLHRDMKPGNVIITKNSVVKVLDFGLSQRRTDEDSEEVIWATPYYVAPETLMREAEDSRTDMYSLGMTLRYLLTGEDSLANTPSSISALLEAKAALPPLSRIMPRAIPSLCDLVDRMTAFNPYERHENYADLLAELGEVREALAARERKLFSPAGLKTPSSKRLFACAGIVAAAFAAYAGGYYMAKPEPQRACLNITPERRGIASVQGLSELESYFKSDCTKLSPKKRDKYIEVWKSAECEPSAAAMGLLHAACVAYLRHHEYASLLSAFHHAVGKMSVVKDAASLQYQLRQISAALKTLEKNEDKKITPKLAEGEYRLKGIYNCLLACYHESCMDVDAAKSAIVQAESDFSLAGDAGLYVSMRKLLKNYTPVIKPAAKEPVAQSGVEAYPEDVEIIPMVVPEKYKGANVLNTAMQCSVLTHANEALQHFSSLKDPEIDPTVSAVAMLHAACITYLQKGNPDDYLSCFFDAAKRVKPDAGREEFQRQLVSVATSLAEPESAEPVNDPRLNGLLHCLLARHYFLVNNSAECKKAMARAEKSFIAASGTSPYASMCALLKDFSVSMDTVMQTTAMHQIPELMAEHEFDEAIAAIDSLLQSEDDVELHVLREICECAAALDVTLKRVMESDFDKAMSAAVFKKKNTENEYFNELRAAEFCSILYLAKGKYAKAFDVNPYKEQGHSNEPFAVMMRDWQTRLEPYMNE